MSTPKDIRERVRFIRGNYPDCPQRQMALDLLRQGRPEQSEAWIQALDKLIEDGTETLFANVQKTSKKSA